MDQAANSPPSYPTDLWVEILWKVPLESLLQLKRVCKCWHQLITDRNFISMHPDLTRHLTMQFAFTRHADSAPKRQVCFLNINLTGEEDDDEIQVTPLPPIVDWMIKAGVLDSYDGLLLIRLVNSSFREKLSLYNPEKRSCEILPNHECMWSFDDWKIVHDASINRYTVIGLNSYGIQNSSLNSKPSCLILDVSGGDEGGLTWKELRLPQDHSCSSWQDLVVRQNQYGVIRPGGARNNGKIYWLIRRFLENDNSFRSGIMRTSLLCFDIAKKHFRIRACSPMPAEQFLASEQFFEYDGTFYVIYRLSEFKMELWVLRYLDSRRPTWMRYHVINNDPLVPKFRYLGFKPLAVQQGTLIMISRSDRIIAIHEMMFDLWTFYDIPEDEEGARAYTYIPHKRII